jgi:hypothetical protein
MLVGFIVVSKELAWSKLEDVGMVPELVSFTPLSLLLVEPKLMQEHSCQSCDTTVTSSALVLLAVGVIPAS